MPRTSTRDLPDFAIVRALVVKGAPMGLQMILVSLAMLVMISMVNTCAAARARGRPLPAHARRGRRGR